MAPRLEWGLSAMFWLGVLLLVAGVARRWRLWRQGRPAPLDLAGLLAVPRRYFVDLHHVVAREPAIARAHVLTAGGGVAILLLLGVNYGLLLYRPALDVATLLCALLMFAGAWQMRARRRRPPDRLSHGGWDRLPRRLLGFAAGVGLAMAVSVLGLPLVAPVLGRTLAALAALGLLLGGAELTVFGIGRGGPMKHAVAGLAHLAFHPRAQRFAGRSTGLEAVDLRRAAPGVARVSDFAWNRLLSFDACVQCGKCEAACPAYAAGQPLNPKALIQGMVSAFAPDGPPYAGHGHPGRPPAATPLAGADIAGADIVGGVLAAETLWSCTTCRACVEACPMLIEHVDTVVDLRRHVTLNRGEVPGKGAEALANLRHTDTVGGFALAARHHWAVDLDLPRLEEGGYARYLLLVGEGAFDMRYQRALRALATVLRRAGVDVALIGAAETDCGDLARRLGDEATFQRLAGTLIDTLARYRFERIVTPDPHLFHCLLNEYPAFGGHFQVCHHSQLLAELLDEGALAAGPAPAGMPTATLHDPCYLGRYNGGYDAPRRVLAGIGVSVVEMARSGPDARCCGWGGGAAFTDIPGARRIPDMRMDDIRASGAARVVVACPNCTAMLEGVVGPWPEVVELAEWVAERVTGSRT
jgi:Fe-S oxidoreductase